MKKVLFLLGLCLLFLLGCNPAVSYDVEYTGFDYVYKPGSPAKVDVTVYYSVPPSINIVDETRFLNVNITYSDLTTETKSEGVWTRMLKDEPSKTFSYTASTTINTISIDEL